MKPPRPHPPCAVARLALPLLLGAFAAVALPAGAQQAQLTLFPEVAPWNEPIEAQIHGLGCSGAFLPPVVGYEAGAQVIDVDLLDCSAASTRSFSIRVPLEPLFPADYLVRVQDARRFSGLSNRITPPPLPFDTRPLSVRFAANVDLELPAGATDATPVTIIAIVLAPSSCFLLDGPTVHERVIELLFDRGCPFLPAPAPGLYRVPVDLGLLPAGIWEIRFREWQLGSGPDDQAIHRESLVVREADRCTPSDTTLCLGQGRFRVEAEWTDFAGHTGLGHARPLDGDGASGLLWFFGPDNVELTIKVLDGCGVNGNWWVFLSSGSTVEYTVTVTDTVSGKQRTYTNASGFSAPLVSDTEAFTCGS